MVNNQLEKWLKQGLKKGYSLHELKERALKQGYSENEIETAISRIKGKKPILKILAFIILIGLIAAAVYLFITFIPPLLQSSNNETKEEIPMPSEEWMQECMNSSQVPENFREGACRGYFYYYLALEKNDSRYCEEIKADEAQRDTCLENLK